MRIGGYIIDNPIALAPMAGITDKPFRRLCRDFGAGWAVCEMLTSDPTLRNTKKTLRRSDFADEGGIVAVQIAGSDPQQMADAARYNVSLGAQVIDINMGCPAKKVCNVQAGSALMQNEPLVAAILEAVVRAAEREFGGLDIAVNNAGIIGAYKPLADISPDEWRDTLDGNLTAAFLGARSQIPLMLARGGGAIVFTSSFVGTSCALPNKTAYGCAKAALAALAKGITADYAAQGIRANALLPGGTDTEMMTTDPQQRAWAEGLHAVKRIARPEEIAAAILFLVSPMGSFVTGTALFADGGNSAVK